MSFLYSEQKAQLRYDTILLYTENVYSNTTSKQSRLFKLQNFKDTKTYSGHVTIHTKKRISKAINIMLQSIEKQHIKNPITKRKEIFKLNFITLTISAKENHLTPKQGYSLLFKKFLQWLTKTIGVKTYIWKAELQKNGQLHYHITTDTWLHHSYIRNKWNYICAKAGMMEHYQKRYGHTNANSTDVHKVYKIRNLNAYLHKELTKSVQNETPTSGKLWDCSKNLKGQKYFTVYFDEIHEKLLFEASTIQDLKEFNGDNFTVIKGNRFLPKSLLTKQESEKYTNWILSIRNQNLLNFDTPEVRKSSYVPYELPKKKAVYQAPTLL